MGLEIWRFTVKVEAMELMLKRTAACFIAAEWLLLSFFCCAGGPAEYPSVPASRSRGAQFARGESARHWAVPFARSQRYSEAYSQTKGLSLGTADSGSSTRAVAFVAGSLEALRIAVGLSRTWQFQLRAALDPRAPCLC